MEHQPRTVPARRPVARQPAPAGILRRPGQYRPHHLALHSRYVEQHLARRSERRPHRRNVAAQPEPALGDDLFVEHGPRFRCFRTPYRLHVRTLRTPKQGPDHHAHDPFGDGIHLDIEQLRRNLKQRYRIHAQHGERPHARLPLGDLDQHRPQHRQGRRRTCAAT